MFYHFLLSFFMTFIFISKHDLSTATILSQQQQHDDERHYHDQHVNVTSSHDIVTAVNKLQAIHTGSINTQTNTHTHTHFFDKNKPIHDNHHTNIHKGVTTICSHN